MSSTSDKSNINCLINLKNYNNILLTFLNGCINNNLIDISSTPQIPSTSLLLDETGTNLLESFNSKLLNSQEEGLQLLNSELKNFSIIQGLNKNLDSKYPGAQLCYKIVFNKLAINQQIQSNINKATNWLQSVVKTKLSINTSTWDSLKTVYICLFTNEFNNNPSALKTISKSLGSCKNILDLICESVPKRALSTTNIFDFCSSSPSSISQKIEVQDKDPTNNELSSTSPETPKALTAPKTTPKALTAPKTTPKALTAPKTTPKALTALKTTPKALTAPKTTPKALTAPKTTPKALTAPKTTPKALTAPKTTPKSSSAFPSLLQSRLPSLSLVKDKAISTTSSPSSSQSKGGKKSNKKRKYSKERKTRKVQIVNKAKIYRK